MTSFPDGSKPQNGRKESNIDQFRPDLLVQWSIRPISITVSTWFGPKRMSVSIKRENVIFPDSGSKAERAERSEASVASEASGASEASEASEAGEASIPSVAMPALPE